MTLVTMSFVLGAILVSAGILGGGFELKEIKIPQISGMARILAMVAGLAFIGLAFMMPEPATQGNDKTTRSRMSAMEWNTDRLGLDYQGFDLTNDDPKLCQAACENDPQCKAWSYVRPNTLQGPKPRCWLKHAIPPPERNPCCVSGTRLS